MKKGSLKRKLTYGMGAIGLDMSYEMFYSYLSPYLTNVLKLKPAFLLFLTPIARIWDGINDPMMGTIVDNTRTKFGRYRPWVITGACCNALVLGLLFTNPGFQLGGLPLYIYIAFMYVFWGMSNTMADIPFWSMVPSFTSDPRERDGIATIARTFSGLGQGIVSILAPVMIPLLGATTIAGEKVRDAQGYSRWAIICAVCLIFFATVAMLNTKENVPVTPKEKFTFKKIFRVAKNNDQLLVFMLFCMLSNAAWYMISGTKVYYFEAVVGNAEGSLSLFNTIGAVGSILGLGVIPILSKFTERRRIYQISLLIEITGFVGMLICGTAGQYFLMNFCYLMISIGSASMFVSQTVFLANIVDYGEIKMGFRSESITFSMKGFLQKMAYTIQTIILFSGLTISQYEEGIYTPKVQSTISGMFLICPIILLVLSLIIFSTKFKLHGKYMESITQQINEKHEELKEGI